jgi:hypothetical protein
MMEKTEQMVKCKGIKRQALSRTMAWFLVAGLVFASGCLFEPREANDPDSGSTWIKPDFPNKVFANMETGLEDLSGGNYERSIGDEFTFLPLPGDLAQLGPEAYANWDAETEESVLQKLLGEASKIEVTFDGLREVSNQGDLVQMEASYSLELTLIDDPSSTETYKGKARYDFLNGSKGYELVKWEDIEAELGFPTWGYLRGILRQR